MKTLFLLRHAKAAAPDGKTEDKDRPLNDVGRDACRRIGSHLKKHKLIPQLILCSTAARTRETCELVLAAAGASPEVRTNEMLYLATMGEMLHFVHHAPDAVSSLMLIAHNPGLQHLAIKLVSEGNANALDGLEMKFPTGALAVIECNVQSWRDLKPDGGFLTHFLMPKLIED